MIERNQYHSYLVEVRSDRLGKFVRVLDRYYPGPPGPTKTKVLDLDPSGDFINRGEIGATVEFGPYKAQREAADRVRGLLSLPMPEASDMLGTEGEFDPWDLFPCLYGSYSGEFDKLAIEVLCELRDKTIRRGDLAAEMFREMLCNADLCEYGTSPRVCFATSYFAEVLPALIERWRAYAELAWGEPVTEVK